MAVCLFRSWLALVSISGNFLHVFAISIDRSVQDSISLFISVICPKIIIVEPSETTDAPPLFTIWYRT